MVGASKCGGNKSILYYTLKPIIVTFAGHLTFISLEGSLGTTNIRVSSSGPSHVKADPIVSNPNTHFRGFRLTGGCRDGHRKYSRQKHEQFP